MQGERDTNRMEYPQEQGYSFDQHERGPCNWGCRHVVVVPSTKDLILLLGGYRMSALYESEIHESAHVRFLPARITQIRSPFEPCFCICTVLPFSADTNQATRDDDDNDNRKMVNIPK